MTKRNNKISDLMEHASMTKDYLQECLTELETMIDEIDILSNGTDMDEEMIEACVSDYNAWCYDKAEAIEACIF